MRRAALVFAQDEMVMLNARRSSDVDLELIMILGVVVRRDMDPVEAGAVAAPPGRLSSVGACKRP